MGRAILEAIFLLQDMFGDAVDVLPVNGEQELRDRLRRFGGHPLLVVIDRLHPCVGPGVARILRTDLSESSAVVWWGADAEEQLDVESTLAGGPRFTAAGSELSLADLGELCMSAVERFSE